MRPCISIRGFVCPYVRMSVRMSICPSVRMSVTIKEKPPWEASYCPPGLVFFSSCMESNRTNIIWKLAELWVYSTAFLHVINREFNAKYARQRFFPRFHGSEAPNLSNSNSKLVPDLHAIKKYQKVKEIRSFRFCGCCSPDAASSWKHRQQSLNRINRPRWQKWKLQ